MYHGWLRVEGAPYRGLVQRYTGILGHWQPSQWLPRISIALATFAGICGLSTTGLSIGGDRSCLLASRLVLEAYGGMALSSVGKELAFYGDWYSKGEG